MPRPDADTLGPSTGAPAGSTTAGAVATRRAGRLAWAVRYIWIWPTLVTLAVVSYRASTPEMGQDELISWSMTIRSTHQILATVHNVDAVHAAYYLLLHAWTEVFGNSLFSMRVPGILAMTGAAAFVSLSARLRFGNWAALTSGLVFALIPAVTRYAHDIRSYPLVVFFVAAATWLLLRALDRPSWWRWLAYAPAVAAAGVFHLVSLVFLGGHGVVVLIRTVAERRPRYLVGFVPAALAAVACTLPVVRLGDRQVGRQLNWLFRPTYQDLPTIWPGLFAGTMVGVAILICAGLPLAWRRGRLPALEFALMGAVPIAAVWVASTEGQVSYWLARYVLFTLPAWAVLAGAGIAAVRPRKLGAGVLVGLALLAGPDQGFMRTVGSHDWFTYPAPPPYGLSTHTVDFRGAARILEAGYRPGDGVVYLHGPVAYRSVDYGVGSELPKSIKMRDVFVQETAIDRNDIWATFCAEPVKCLGSEPRLWVVTLGVEADNPFPTFPKNEVDAIKSAYTVTEVHRLADMTVTLVDRTPGH
ncbi:glycosyltransferase family 39 protein [Kitasatospora sp. NPDC048540]|uniref:glycosyltransferase family 39 protein n=1 Tax=unclassified Kitasatospora TaxID=2633591 RepID=UPI00053A5D49|nr:glycosyltransferase family 39 protein [Kitasatospora sp. MBT63]